MTRKRNPVVPLAVGLAGAALIGLLVYGIATRSPIRTLDDAIAVGLHPLAPAATQTLPVLGGAGKRSLSSYAGHVVVLNFWASWCEPCREEAPRLERLQRQLAHHGATVLGVTYKDTAADSEGFVRQYHLTYLSLRDTTGEFAHGFGTDALPESFVIDRSGRVVAISRGEAEEAFLQRGLSLAESS
ncbi:MAG TPA: TlpA disulfide reductase family protein [Solirubrobacteraceae bacterium]|jgi:cytochrome c biogenesis protein CcmG/thiol:disulfide interchange protein DsbE|nr:TlpA disulfide reductase family protein [Solirubrobacteraceae bacterium]